MNARTIKWTLFVTLFLTAPALLFLVQVVMFLPAVLYLAGMVLFVGLAFVSGSTSQSLVLFTFLGLHVLVHAGLYYLIAALAAQAIARIPWRPARNATGAVLCAGLVGVTCLPVYGGGGHGPMRWRTLPAAFAEVSKGRGLYAAVLVYGAAVLVIGTVLLVRWHRARRQVRCNTGTREGEAEDR
jgi:hypothetical protein